MKVPCYYLNTSHVKSSHDYRAEWDLGDFDLNTSHVKSSH